MGERPYNMTLDRINNNGNYEKENCRWTTHKEQSRNMRNNRLVTFENQTKTLAEWAEIKNIIYATLLYRLNQKWPVEKLFLTPKYNIVNRLH